MQEISSKLPRDLASVTINFEAAKGSYMSLMRSTTSWLSEKDPHKPLLPNTRNWHEMSSKISETSGLALRCPFKFASPNTRVTDNMPSTRGRSPEYIHIYTRIRLIFTVLIGCGFCVSTYVRGTTVVFLAPSSVRLFLRPRPLWSRLVLHARA